MWAIIIGTASTDFCCSNLLLHLSSKQQAGVCVNASCLFLQDSRAHSCFNSLNFFLQMITNLEQLSRQTPAAGHKHSSAVTQPVPPQQAVHTVCQVKSDRERAGASTCVHPEALQAALNAPPHWGFLYSLPLTVLLHWEKQIYTNFFFLVSVCWSFIIYH